MELDPMRLNASLTDTLIDIMPTIDELNSGEMKYRGWYLTSFDFL
jgi:hypothetical protein